MDVLNAEENLCQLWMLYTSKNDDALFQSYLKVFLETYQEYVDVEFSHLGEGFMAEGPHLTKLPEGLPQVISRQLTDCDSACASAVDTDMLEYAEALVKCLIIISRNVDNVPLLASCSYVTHTVSMATVVLSKLSLGNVEDMVSLTSFIRHILHFLQCLYDPAFSWHKQRHGWNVDYNKMKQRPAALHVEVVPFLYESFQQVGLDVNIQIQLLHVFGAIISGAQENALRAVCPATLDILLKALRIGTTATTVPPNDAVQHTDLVTLKSLVLKCLVNVVHCLHTCSPDQRQVEVWAVFEGYSHVLLGLEMSADNTDLQLNMLGAIESMLECDNRAALQLIFVVEGIFDTFVTILTRITQAGNESYILVSAVIRVIMAVMSGSQAAKDLFRDQISYTKFVDAVKSLGQPSQDLLTVLLDLVIEGSFESGATCSVRNPEAAIMLIQWLPDIQSHDLQTWLSESLCRLCTSSVHNRLSCCSAGMIGAILGVLRRHQQINARAIGSLINLLESLGIVSITAAELRKLIQLLKPDQDNCQIPYFCRLLQAMSAMARRDGREVALHYFDFHDANSGVVVPCLKRWPGFGFTFHTWICLDNRVPIVTQDNQLVRRQLYSFLSSTGNGFEAFVTAECTLVVAVCTKKDYNSVTVVDNPLSDQNWHCIDIVHACSRRPFTQSQLCVYIDGRLRLTEQLKFPPVTEPFSHCQIACPGLKLSANDPSSTPAADEPHRSRLQIPGLSFRLRIPMSMRGMTIQSDTVHTLEAGCQNDQFGVPISLIGQISSVCVFHEALTPNHVRNMFLLGPNCLTLFQTEEASLTELSSKLVLHYNAKASEHPVCLDLSYNQNDGQLIGQNCSTYDIKDVINCIGGIQVLFPLLEQLSQTPSTPREDLPTNGPSPSKDIDCADWVVVPSSSYADCKLEQAGVALFVVLLKNMLQSHLVNQETLVREHALATLGILFQKVEPQAIDVSVLMALQLLVEMVAPSDKQLLHHIYQFVLFDFRLWSRSDFTVRIGHIQYLSTIIKDDKKYFRKKYGVQYLLDVINTYYSCPEDSQLEEEDCRTIRLALLSLIKYYVYKAISFEELSQLLAFILSVKCELLMCEVVDMLLALLETPGGLNKKQDQMVLLMYEPNMAELLYVLIADSSYPIILKEKILKMLLLLLETDKVNEKSKSRLRLSELGLYPGLVSLMSHSQVSLSMVHCMLMQVFCTDSPSSYDAALSILQLLPGASVEVKLAVTRQLLLKLFSKQNATKLFAKQLSWQQILVRLFITGSQSEGTTRTLTSDTCVPGSPEPESTTSSQSMNDPSTPVAIPSFSAGDVNLTLALLGDTPADRTSQEHDSLTSPLLDRIPAFDLTTPTNLSPQFSHMAMFDDSDVFESDWSNRTGRFSRSSSASVEDVSQQGAAHASCSSESAVTSSSDPNLVTLGSQGSAGELGNSETNEASGIGASTASGAQAKTASGGEECLLDVVGELRKIGIKFEHGGTSQDPMDELCDNLLAILFMVIWKGVDGPRAQAWKDRGQVHAAVNYTSETHALLRPAVDIKRCLLELMLQGCIIDLKQAGQTNPIYTENATEMMHMIYNFLCLETEGASRRFSELIIEDVLTLLDLLTVWDQDNEWREMKQLGLTILLAFAAQNDIVLCSIAAARLHTLLQTHPVEKLQESCFVMAAIDDIITKALPENGEHYNFLIPVMKALVNKSGDLLNMKTYLPGLPTTHLGATFFDDFKMYIHRDEWRSFMRKQVIPSKEQYLSNSYDRIIVTVKTHLGECHEEMMINSHRRNRMKGESKLKFQADIGDAFKSRVRHERKRYMNTMTQLRSQHSSALRQWRSTKMFITGERGVWTNETTQDPQHWKLSNQENFSRMRPKLVPNYNFDLHTDASRLRDNLMVEEPTEELPSLLREAKVSDEDIGDDRLEDDEWNLISAVNTATEEASGKEKLVLSETCELVTMMDVIKGRLEVTTTHVYFFDCTPNKEEGGGEDFKWALSQLREIHFRRYNLRRSALELFLINQSNYFLNFQKKVRNKVYTRILSLQPANLIYYGSRSPAELLRASGLTQKWVQGEISNFTYLMQLNTIAGRTYNDLSQYPVFPWILCDYTSETLNLDDEKIYRDLSRPLGVVNPKNEEQVKEKYEHFEDPTGTVEKFHYGTHYSNAAGVMHYLIRMEPFTTLHIQLQSDRFDVADRQFHSIASTWRALMENPNDVKELIPEFFYLPEFLQNINRFDFGTLQGTDNEVNDVILPKWASSPEDFIHKHMRALESAHVSQHLHHWIDLIFGYKQKGPEAVKVLNVFYYCTYEGAVDLDAVTNPTERKALEGIINNFGQTPCQLLKEPHPKRMSFEEVVAKAAKSDKPLSLLLFLNLLKAFYVEASVDHVPLAYVSVPRNQARSFIQQGMPDTMVAVTQEGLLLIHGWLPYDRSISHYFTFERDTMISTVRSKRVLAGPFAPGLKVTPSLFAVSHDAKLVFSGGHWDNSVRVYSLNKQKMVAHIVRHTDIVTCLALDNYGQHVITGSRDTTCMVWQVIYQSGMSQGLSKRPTQILYGHTDHVTCVAISEELDMAASGSKDGTVIVHTMRKGTYMRTLRPLCERGLQLSVEQLVLSDVGQICLYCEQHLPSKPAKQTKLDLHLYSVNGKHLASETLLHPLSHMIITDGHLVFGSSQGTLVVKELFGLKTLSTVTLHIPITCMTVTNGNCHILAGLSDGKLIIIGIKKNSEVK